MPFDLPGPREVLPTDAEPELDPVQQALVKLCVRLIVAKITREANAAQEPSEQTVTEEALR